MAKQRFLSIQFMYIPVGWCGFVTLFDTRLSNIYL